MSHLTAGERSTGKGYALPGLRPWVDLLSLPDMAGQYRDAYTVANDLYFGNLPPPAVQIPYSWISPPARFRPDQPINTVTIGQGAAGSAYATDSASVAEHGAWTPPGNTSLQTGCDADPQNLAEWLVAYYANPRMRMPALTLNLLQRTNSECHRILSCDIGDHIRITGAPVRWPRGTPHLVVEGKQHTISAENRTVTWNTSPVIGVEPGTAGPWARADQSQITGTDAWAF